MKKIILIILSIIAFNYLQAQYNPTGFWEGKLNVGVFKMRINFTVTRNDSGYFNATIDSPDQNVKGVSCSKVSVTTDSLIIEIKAAGAKYYGRFKDKITLEGLFVQGFNRFPLSLKHVEKFTERNLYQTPKPPFNYNVDSVEYDNADKTVHLGATLTYPKTKGTFPVAVMITGSGFQDRDETIFGHKPFVVIANYLTNHGIAVLRVDDRMMGKSKGDIKDATALDFANDVITSINYLLTRKEIDKNKIGVIGHSEGGFIAPVVYTKYPKLAFIVSLAGTGVSGAAILVKQQTDPLKGKVSQAAYEAYYKLSQQILNTVHDYANEADSLIMKRTKKVYTDWKASYNDSILLQLNVTEVGISLLTKEELKPEYKYFIATEPDQFWSKVKCPVLVLNGEKDVQVYAEQNTKAIATSLKKAGNKNTTVKIFPQLNHMFQHCKECSVAEYAELEETFSPEVLELMNNWLQKNIVEKH